jgi:crotonobetainyl-CoA:carnitine CoA-transferase CaiB-like acyl-CoA transferase
MYHPNITQLKQGILLALLEKQLYPERGPHCVNVSLFQSGVSALANQASAYLNLGAVPVRMGSDHPSICPYGTVFNCRDKPVTLAVGADSQFRHLCKVLQISDLANDPRFATNVARVANRELVKSKLADAISEWSRDELLEQLSVNAVPAGAVNDLADVFALPKASALAIEHTNEHCTGLRQTVFMKDAAPGLLPPPRYGQHTLQVLRDVVGLSEDEVTALADNKVVSLGVDKSL